MNFGEYLYRKRLEKGMEVIQLAGKLKISPTDYLDVERNRDTAFQPADLKIISECLHLRDEEIKNLFRLADDSWGKVESAEEYLASCKDSYEIRCALQGESVHLTKDVTIKQIKEWEDLLDEIL